jgi:alcohol dehydrogenase, propanol-preferring
LCTKLGATYYLDFGEDKIKEKVHEITAIGAHAVTCVAAPPSAYDSALALLRNCGTLVCVGIPPTSYPLSLSPFELLVRGIKVVGTSIGNRVQMAGLLQMAVEGKVQSHVEMFEFHNIDGALKSLQKNEITGRAVVRIPQ